ncbi:hypothetical protein Pla175_41830 [Pirellulimonas nuda]|uniref:Uncharacterized protein n=1 Tax=Pirellulimonas nuda TaxID=2528009 RepID=A0A518DH15_9BACT|nr:hypothetical protein [Pirellulimonas nuda]QDU90770.1 hypothetical protein Pla175_41830 [Pirellulimonas nuda]
MFRTKALVVLGGAVLAYFGIQELRVGMSSTPEPVGVDLAEVESGAIIDNNHWLLSEHVAVFGAAIYEYEKWTGNGGKELDERTKCTWCYYPVMSYDHEYVRTISALEAEYGSLDKLTDQELPALDGFKVLVRTKEFKTVGDIPSGLEGRNSVQGLVVSRIEGLGSDEKKLMSEGFPGLDLDDLLLLEAGRRPTSVAASSGMIAGGVALLVAGAVWMLRRNGAADSTTTQDS